MLLLAKVALGFGGTLVLAGAYTFHDGVLQVDEDHVGGRHVHVWVPAAVVPIAMHVVPKRHIEHAAEQMQPFLPTIRALTKGLKKYPEVELVDVSSPGEHVNIRTHNGKLLIDVYQEDEQVHVACPLAMLEHVSHELEYQAPRL
jgi:hypothetical protein